MHQLNAIADAVIITVKGYVAKAEAVLSGRIEALEEKIKSIPSGKDGKDGQDGKDGADGQSIQGEAGKDGADGINGQDGKDGADGKSIEIDAIKSIIGENVKDAVSDFIKSIPIPQDGKSVTIEEVHPVVADLVSKAVAAIAIPKNGVDGKDGIDGKCFTIEDVRNMLEAEQAKWALEFERRAADVLQRAIDRMPAAKDGKDGRDAFQLDDLDLTQSEDGRTVTLSFKCGDQVKEKSFKLEHPLDRGVYRQDAIYSKGDSVTWGGSSFIAQKTAPIGKPGDSEDWRLSVKRGQNGKDAVTGEPQKREPVRLK